MVHDDTLRRARPHVIRRLDIAEVEGLHDIMISRLDASMLNRQIAAGTAEGVIVWFNIDSLREEGRVEAGGIHGINHNAPILAMKFFNEPVMGTADADGKVMFWTMRPLPLFEVFARTVVNAGSDKKKAALSSGQEDDTPEAVTAAAFIGDPGDESLLIGTDAALSTASTSRAFSLPRRGWRTRK